MELNHGTIFKAGFTISLVFIWREQSLVYIPGCPGTCYGAQAVLKLCTVLPLPPKC